MALLALGASFLSTTLLNMTAIPSHSMSFLIAQMNGVLTAMLIGGLYTVPGLRSIAVALGAAVFASIVSLSTEGLLWHVGLPVLALPFVLVSYVVLIALSPERGGPWLSFWLAVPALPEKSREQLAVAKVRGIDLGSTALKSPFSGSWQVYQGFDGAHTHQGAWKYALDFFQTVEGKNDGKSKSEGEGKSFKNDGTKLSDYYCFGQPVFAPAYGWVADMRDDLPDNRPGEVDVVNNWGNYMLIRLDGHGYVLLAHLKKGSVKVLKDTRVVPGQILAACGNSGRSPRNRTCTCTCKKKRRSGQGPSPSTYPVSLSMFQPELFSLRRKTR